MLAIQDYDIEIEFIQGKKNFFADAMSSRFDQNYVPVRENEILISSVLYKNPNTSTIKYLKNIEKLQNEDKKIFKIKEKIFYEINEKLMKIYVIENNVLKKN